MDFGIVSVSAITVICYLVGLVVKIVPNTNNKYIPIACGISGGMLGLAALAVNLSDFPATDPITAVAIGIVSGLSATGVDQCIKQFEK